MDWADNMTLLATNLPASAPRLLPPPRSGRIFSFPDAVAGVQPLCVLQMDAFQMDRAVLASVGETWPGSAADPLRIALIGGYTPRRCGIATFTADVHASITAGFPHATVDVYAMAPKEFLAGYLRDQLLAESAQYAP